MKKNILLSLLSVLLITISITAVADEDDDDDSPIATQHSSGEPSAKSNSPTDSSSAAAQPIEIIISEASTDAKGEKKPPVFSDADFHGPYSLYALPKDVQDRIIRGLDSSDRETVSEMLRRKPIDYSSSSSTRRPADPVLKPNMFETADPNDGLVNLVRNVREGNIGKGFSVKYEKKSFDTVGGQRETVRTYWLRYKRKF